MGLGGGVDSMNLARAVHPPPAPALAQAPGPKTHTRRELERAAHDALGGTRR